MTKFLLEPFPTLNPESPDSSITTNMFYKLQIKGVRDIEQINPANLTPL